MTRRPLHHALLSAAFLALAGLRVADGAGGWAVLFASVGVGYLWLWVRRRHDEGAAPDGPGGMPEPGRVVASVRGHVRTARLWSAISVGSALGGAAVLLSEPTLALVLGALSVVALYLGRRSRRTAASLGRLAPPPATPTSAR